MCQTIWISRFALQTHKKNAIFRFFGHSKTYI
ncbi:hypothetical protein F383_05015 [Gossypium arboreum]|uniref:Uncharacterized protein n=1 Tax=Gossypium arboreum TaxID=29729 RepID=A0A0B0PBN9_GOSAR|nr:hypothetical protein F383_05015 [Gossypium arboreum]